MWCPSGLCPRPSSLSHLHSTQQTSAITVQHGSADTVVRAMNAFNGKCHFSGYASSAGTPPYTQVLGSIGSKGACLRMREIVTLRRLFFNGPCASLQVGPLDRLSPLTAQMTRPRGHHVLFMVSLIREIFSLFFAQKCEKLHYALWQIRRAITRERLKTDANCFHQTVSLF